MTNTLGCLIATNVTQGTIVTSLTNTPGQLAHHQCSLLCQSNGYPIFALSQSYCGCVQVLLPNITGVPQQQCSAPCRDCATDLCGSTDQNLALFSTSVSSSSSSPPQLSTTSTSSQPTQVMAPMSDASLNPTTSWPQSAIAASAALGAIFAIGLVLLWYFYSRRKVTRNSWVSWMNGLINSTSNSTLRDLEKSGMSSGSGNFVEPVTEPAPTPPNDRTPLSPSTVLPARHRRRSRPKSLDLSRLSAALERSFSFRSDSPPMGGSPRLSIQFVDRHGIGTDDEDEEQNVTRPTPLRRNTWPFHPDANSLDEQDLSTPVLHPTGVPLLFLPDRIPSSSNGPLEHPMRSFDHLSSGSPYALGPIMENEMPSDVRTLASVQSLPKMNLWIVNPDSRPVSLVSSVDSRD